MKIRAFAIKEKGGNSEPFTYDREIGKNDVLVRITHCSIATGDVQFINDDWGDAKFPLVPGHEIIGFIEQTGRQVHGLKNGDRVGIGYQQEACFECPFCIEGYEQFCPKQKVIAVDRYGGWAEHIVVDYRFAFQLPPSLDSARSTPLLSSGLTVYSAIKKAVLQDKAVAGVLGVGGLGSLAIQFLNKMGHRVAAFSHSPEKRAAIEALGAEYVDTSTLELRISDNRKYDFILSTLNAGFDLNTYLRMLKPRGKFCFVASPLKTIPLNVGLLYDNAQRTVYGNYVGSRKDMTDMLAFAAEQGIESNVDVLPFSRINEAIELVREKYPKRLVLQHG